MVAIEDLRTEFEAIGIDPGQDVLLKCLDICDNCGISDAEEFVEQWMAYSISKLNGAEPTVALLGEFELKAGLQGNKEHDQEKKRRDPVFKSDEDTNFDALNSALLSAYGLPAQPIKEHGQSPMEGVEPSEAADLAADDKRKPGQAIYTFGKSSNWSEAGRRRSSPKVMLLSNDNDETLDSAQKYLFETIPDKSGYLREILFNLGKAITDKLKFQDSQKLDRFSQVDVPSQQVLHCIGRVSYENDMKLTPHSAILVGTDSEKMRKVCMNFSRLPSFSLFPGQVVYATGMNPNGDQFFITQIDHDRDLEPPQTPSVTEIMNVVIASGPFTSKGNLRYQPLDNVLNWCRNNGPDVLILTGPFLEENHPEIGSLNESFESFFDKLVNKVMEALASDSTHTQVLMVASQADVNSSNVFPTHPHSTSRSFNNLKMLPDPSLVEIGGCVFGISSTDIISHFSQEELALNAGPDKVKRYVKYMLNQKSFYPISPPHPDINLDVGLLSRFGRLKIVPNFLVLPSEMRPFARNIEGCLALNPGRVSDETAGGSFARLVINPPSTKTANMMEYIGCQILRI